MDNIIKLLPCPFCGSQPELMEGHRNHWRVECPRCGVRRAQFANGGVEEDKARAIRSWNEMSAYNPAKDVRQALFHVEAAAKWLRQVRNTQHSSNMVELVGRVLSAALGPDPKQRSYDDLALLALEASHHAELVERPDFINVATGHARYDADERDLILRAATAAAGTIEELVEGLRNARETFNVIRGSGPTWSGAGRLAHEEIQHIDTVLAKIGGAA